MVHLKVRRWKVLFEDNSVARCWNKKLLKRFHNLPQNQLLQFDLKSQSLFSKLPKKSPNIWATFERKFVAKNFQKRPIWSHWTILNCLTTGQLSSLFTKYNWIPISQVTFYLQNSHEIAQFTQQIVVQTHRQSMLK